MVFLLRSAGGAGKRVPRYINLKSNFDITTFCLAALHKSKDKNNAKQYFFRFFHLKNVQDKKCRFSAIH